MQRTTDMPLWVFLGLANIDTRKGALILFWSLLRLQCRLPALVLLPSGGLDRLDLGGDAISVFFMVLAEHPLGR